MIILGVRWGAIVLRTFATVQVYYVDLLGPETILTLISSFYLEWGIPLVGVSVVF